MKNLFPILFLIIIGLSACTPSLKGVMVKEINNESIVGISGKKFKIPGKEKGQTTFFLVRHAEKEKGKDPELTAAGKERANRLASILKNRPLKQVYSTDFKRTQATARPTAEQQTATVLSYEPENQEVMVKQLLSKGGGYNYLIVGHSNTVPQLLNLFEVKKVYENIPETEYDNLYMVITAKTGKSKVIELKY